MISFSSTTVSYRMFFHLFLVLMLGVRIYLSSFRVGGGTNTFFPCCNIQFLRIGGRVWRGPYTWPTLTLEWWCTILYRRAEEDPSRDGYTPHHFSNLHMYVFTSEVVWKHCCKSNNDPQGSIMRWRVFGWSYLVYIRRLKINSEIHTIIPWK